MRLTARRFALALIVLSLSLSCLCLISSASASPLVTIEVSSNETAYESLTVLNPGNGNWIEMVGGEEVSLPIINLVYNINSTNYTKEDKEINIIPYVKESEDYSVHYPFSTHSVYYNGDIVTVKVLGEDNLTDKLAHIYLIKTCPSELNSTWNSAFDGDMKPLRDLLGNPTHKNISLDSVGDCTASFGTLDPGDYVVVAALNESTALNITFISTTAFEVLEHKSTLEAPDVITITSPSDCVFASGDFTIIGAGTNAMYTYIVALIRKDEKFDLRWDSNETKSELNLKLSDAPLDKSINIFGGIGLGNLDATNIYDWIKSFQTASVEKGVKSGNTYYFSMPVMNMSDGDYYLYAMAYNQSIPERQTFVFAVSQQSVKIETLTKPKLAISLTASPKTIEANGIAQSTITALVTDESGKEISGINVSFSTTRGNFTSTNTTTTTTSNITANGIATATLNSSTSPGTAVVTGSITIDGSFVNDTVLVAFINTTVATADKATNISIRKQTYTPSDARVGTIESSIDVVFNNSLRNVTLELSLFDDPDFIDSKLKDTIADALEAVFGLEGVSASDAKSSTSVVIRAKLSAENLTKEDVKEVPIEITIGKKWFEDVAQENVNNLRIFKINDTTREVEPGVVTIVAETDTNVTFSATFDHFCVFALVARPPAAVASTAVIHRGARRTPTPTPALIPPVPRDTTAPIISNITVTIERYVIISWDTNEISDSLVKCGMKSGQYTIEEHAPDYVLFHVIPLKQIQLKNIYENTTYYFVVNSTDPNGNSAQTEEYIFVLTPPEKRAIMPFILQIPITLYTHVWWILPTTILVLIITIIVMPRYKSKRNFNSLTGKPTGTEILMYLYTTFPNVSRPADISKNTNVNLNGVLEALHSISNKNRLESLLGIGLVDKVEYDDEVCYYISKRGKTLIDGLKESFIIDTD